MKKIKGFRGKPIRNKFVGFGILYDGGNYGGYIAHEIIDYTATEVRRRFQELRNCATWKEAAENYGVKVIKIKIEATRDKQ